nr:wiskott-Aldrich syndrome protein homolog 1-like [Manis javanica]
MQDSRLPPGEGSPGRRSRRCPPSFPPSLCLVLPPSLPPSRATAPGPSRGQPVLDQIQLAASGHTSWTRLCSCRGVRGLLPRPRRPPRSALCVLHTLGRRPPAAQIPNRPQGPSYRLSIRLPTSPLASAREPTPLPSAAKVHTQFTLSVLPLPARIPLLVKAPAKPHSGCGPAPDCKPPLHGPTQSPVT